MSGKVTPQVLQAAEQEREADRARRIEIARRETEAFSQAVFDEIDTMLAGDFGKYLRTIRNADTLIMDADSGDVWLNSATGEKQHQYGGSFHHRFSLSPQGRHAKKFARVLAEAGFRVKFTKREVGNTTFEPTADGYDIVSLPGTHTVWSLTISWANKE